MEKEKMQTNTVTLTLPNLTPVQAQTLLDILKNDFKAEEPTAKRTRKSKPETTVSDEEEESFGSKELDEEDLSDDDAPETGEETESEEDEDDALDFATVKAALNKYGETNPESMKSILLTHNLKSTKELKANPKKWEPVYRKTMLKLKALKKAK